MNTFQNLRNKLFNRSKSYPGVIKEHKHNDLMEVRICTSNNCSTCKKMVFQDLKKCNECNKRKICVFCYDDGKKLCKDCDDELMKLYDKIEEEMKEELKIEDFVDQLL